MNAHKTAEAMCIRAEKVGLCHPTEGMIAEALDNVLSDQFNEINYELRSGGHEKAAEYLERLHDVHSLEAGE